MIKLHSFRAWARLLRHAGADEHGGVALIAAALIVVLLAATGAAIDVSRSLDSRQRLQTALDASLLAAASESLKDEDTIKRKVLETFTARRSWGKELSNVTVELAIGEDSIEGVATADYANTLLGAVWRDRMTVRVASQVKAGQRDIEVALVLDNTGSMASQNRMGIMKASVNNFISEMQKLDRESSTTTVKVGLVPYETRVRLDTSLRNEPWLNFDEIIAHLEEKAAEEKEGRGRGRGRGWGRGGRRGGEENEQQGKVTEDDARNAWEGCVWDRRVIGMNRYDSHIDMVMADENTHYPATLLKHQVDGNSVKMWESCDLTAVLPLTDNFVEARTRVATMRPDGYTNVGLGLIWGWNLVDPAAPFTEGKAYTDPKVLKFIVLLTDGDNTFNRRGYTEDPHEKWGQDYAGRFNRGMRDESTEDTCANLKKTPIKVFTIRVVDGNAGLLRDCASSPDMFYDIRNPNEMRAVFNEIADRIKQVHLSM